MQHYRHFGQGESGVFTRENTIDDLVGTSNVGPCVVLFLHNRIAKDCYAIHFDDRIHFAAIRRQIRKYIGVKQNLKDLQAFLVGGWVFFKNSDHAAIQLLDWLKKLGVNNNIDKLYQKHGTPSDTRRMHYYDSVIFDIAKGTLCSLNAANFVLGPEFDPFTKKKADCFRYIRNNAIPLSDSIVTTGDLDTINFYGAITAASNGTPIIPAVNFEQELSQELLKLANEVKNGNALGVIKCLYNGFVNPATAISPADGYTPLHYACAELRTNPGNYEREVIVFLMLLHAQRDLAASNGRTALSILPDSFFKTKCAELLVFIGLQTTQDGINYRFVKQYRDVTACLANSVIQYRKSPPWLQDAIHNQLAADFKKLFSVPIPKRAPTNLNHVILFLTLLFLLYRFYDDIDSRLIKGGRGSPSLRMS